MIKFHRIWKYLIVYVLLLIITAIFTVEKIIRPIDLAVYKEFYLKSEYAKKYKDEFLDKDIDKVSKEINEKIIFIDIPTENWPKGTFLINLRSHVADLLKTIDSMVPVEMSEMDKPVIILDITFKSDEVGLDSIYNSMWSLIEKEIKVYASYRLPEEDDDIKYEDHDEKQAYSLYDDYFTSGRLNTYFYSHKKVNGLASYHSFEVLDDTIIKSLPAQVAKDLGYIKEEIDLRNQNIYPLPLKLPFNKSSIEDNYYVFTSDSTSTEKNFSKLKESINLIKKVIIIGTPEDMQQIGDYEVPGPYIVATALIDQLNGNKFTKSAHENIAVQLTLIIFFPFIVCIFFMVIYKYIKKLQTYPAIIAIVSWIIGVIVLITLGLILLEYAVIRPTFPILSMVYVSILTWHFTKQFLVLGIMEGSREFDVFISYSRSKSDWVKKHLLNPLKEIKKPDGSELKIFFDEKSIGIGEHFTTKYMRSIIDSKFFIPVMSEDYYNKNHCRNELDIAVKRNVEKLMEMLILALDYKYVPEEFNHINFIEAKPGIDFISRIKKELIKVETELSEDENESEEINHTTEQPISKTKPLNSEIKAKKDKEIKENITEENEQMQLEIATPKSKSKEEEELVIANKEKVKSDKKDKKSEKKENKKKEKQKSKREEKEIEKKSKKEEKEKSKKKDKKAKKKSDKKDKKSEKKKDKKVDKKKAKKSSNKKDKKKQKKKGK